MWILLAIYVLGVVVATPVLLMFLRLSYGSRWPITLKALGLGLAWPLVLLFVWLTKVPDGFRGRLAMKTKKTKGTKHGDSRE